MGHVRKKPILPMEIPTICLDSSMCEDDNDKDKNDNTQRRVSEGEGVKSRRRTSDGQLLNVGRRRASESDGRRRIISEGGGPRLPPVLRKISEGQRDYSVAGQIATIANMTASKYAHAWRRPSAFFTIGEGSDGDESDHYNEFDSDDDTIPGPAARQRKKSLYPVYSSNSSLESDTELGLQVAERRKNRRKSFAPMHPGLQTWVEIKGLGDKNDGPKPGELLPIGKKKKATYEELREFVNAGKIKETKNSVRDNDWDLTEEIRSRLWPLLDSIHETNKSSLDGFYWDTATQLYGSEQEPKVAPDEELALPGFTDPQNRLYFALSSEGIARCRRIICVVGYAYPEITYCPMLLPVSSLFLHFITEEETYNCICTLLSARNKVFLTQTKSQWDVAYITAMHLTKKFSKPAFTFLSRNVKSGEKLENVFQGWIWWIFRDLPLTHLVRVMDCFLMEGMKVLYRTTIALLLSFSKACSSDSTWANYLESSGLESAISKYCREISMTPQRLLKSAFSIRAFRGSEIRKVSTKVEMLLKSTKGTASALPKMKKSKSNENLPSSQSQMDIQMMSHTLAIKEGKTTPDHKTHSMGVYLCQDFKSTVTSKDSLLVLWQWLPVRITMYQPVLLYTSDEHGCSLTTFFNRVENHEPTLLIIKTTTDEVFGAYCSTMWAARNQKDEHGERQRYFGTGETFLFTLWPERKKYPWVGIKPREDDSDGEGENDSPKEKSRSRARGDELFMHADTHMISVGGGQGQGICLDEDLRFGKSESCTTFNNPPLCESKDFEVRVLEVIGFTGM